MRMNRRAFSQAAAAAQPTPGEQYTVHLWSISWDEPFVNGSFPDGVYGVYSAGEVVDVDLSGIREVWWISNVAPYDFSLGSSIEFTWMSDLWVQFVMPPFDVVVDLETA